MGLFKTTHVHQHRTEVVSVPQPYCREIKEFKAPTDESIRLLNEMTAAARKNIVDSIKIESNFFKANVVYFQEPGFSDTYRFCAKCNLNGHEIYIEDAIERHDFISAIYHEKGIKLLIQKFSEEIAAQIIEQQKETFIKFLKH